MAKTTGLLTQGLKAAKNYIKKAAPATKKAAPATKKAAPATKKAAKETRAERNARLGLELSPPKVAALATAGVGGAGYLASRGSDKKAAPAATTKAPIVTKKQLEDSGFTNLRDYMNDKKGLTRRDGKAPERRGDNNGGNIASRTDNSDGSKVGPNLNQVNKPDAKSTPSAAKTEDGRSTMQKLFGASEEKRAMGRNLQDNARKSMGMKKGGAVKSRSRSINGIAVRGLTRAKHK
jgi:hypothetical protein